MAQPPDFAVRKHGRLPQSHPYGQPGVYRGVLYETARGPWTAQAVPWGADLPVCVPCGRAAPADFRRALRGSQKNRSLVPGCVRWRQLFPGNPGPRHSRTVRGQPPAHPHVQRNRHPARGDQRRALPDPGGRRASGCADGHPDGQDRRRPHPHEIPNRGILYQERGRDAAAVCRRPGGAFQYAPNRRALPGRIRVRQVPPAPIRRARRLHRRNLPAQALRRGLRAALSRRRRGGAPAPAIWAWYDRENGLCRLFPDCLRFHRLC